MYNDSAMIMMLNTLTSTHPGSGTELSYVDMPIQREGHTAYPKIEASTLKGCIRSGLDQGGERKDEINRIFGKPDGGEFASAVSMTDARILFFPVKSVKGIFGWVTCPFVLDRFFKDYQLAFGKEFCHWDLKRSGIITKNSKLSQEMSDKTFSIMLEDYTYPVEECEEFGDLIKAFMKLLPENTVTRDMIMERAVILSDDDFSDFVKYSTEVNTRIKIDTLKGTVAGTALFTEEYLPPECVLYSLLFFTDAHFAQAENNKSGDETGDSADDKREEMNRKQVRDKFLELFPGGTIQVGANSTLGKGVVQVNIWKHEN